TLQSFFSQAEDGIRARNVTGVQTCALPIYSLNVNANVIFNTANQGELTEDLGPGESMDVQVFPRGLARVSALQRVTLTIAGASEIGRASCREGVEIAVGAGRWHATEKAEQG